MGYMDTCYDKTMKQLTAESLKTLTTSEKVCHIMAEIEAEADEEKKGMLKQKLPVVFYACQLTEGGVRPTTQNQLAIPTGLCMHDWDHMEASPRDYYQQHIAGREEELGIVLAHITPRGQGLRLVTLLQNGESITSCQRRLANLFGMTQIADPKVKDITRMSFLPSEAYMLYINEVALFEREMEDCTNEVEIIPEVPSLKPEAIAEAPSIKPEAIPEVPSLSTLSTPSGAQECPASFFYYEGLRYSVIIEALLKRIATQGMPREGERNEDLFTLVRELRHICQYNFQQVYMLVAPYFPTLPDAEIRRTISNAIATNGRTMTPMMRGVLNELKNENIEQGDEAEGLQLPKLPRLSAVEEMILSHYPKHIRSQAYMAMLPIWGLYGTHIRFDYMDGRENSLSFMTAIVGKSGSGKAFAAHLFEQMTKRFRLEDALERQKADEYLALLNKTPEGSEKPDDPRPRVRIYGDDISTSQFLDYLDNLKGEHGIQFTEEVARLQKAKRTIYGDNDDLYCKAFDNAVGGKESKSKLTRNIRIPIFLNTLFCGTPGAMHKFYNNPEGGLNNRIIYAFMPKVRMKGFPHYEKFNEQEQAQFDELAERLWEAGQDGVKIQLPWLEKTISMIKSKWDKEDEENPDEVWYDLGKRSMVVAMRAGVLEWFLRGCPSDEKQIREINKVVKWVADAMRQGVYAFSGKEYEEINETDNLYQQKQVRMTKNKKLFSCLNEEFTTQDVITQRIQNGDSAKVAMVLCRWVADGLVQKISNGRYKKMPQLAV